jgi:hypothetical protein
VSDEPRGGASGPWPRGVHVTRQSIAFVILSLSACVGVSAQAAVVDRIVAVVAGQAITWSDVRAARALGLVPASATASDATIVDALVVRELMRSEVDRFSVAAPESAEVDARVAAARARLSGADAAAALDALGLSEPRLRAWIEDDRRIERYLDQRFDVAATPTDEEVVTYFQSREREFTKDGRPQPFAAVSTEVRTRLMAERRRQLIDEWVAGLRRRAVVMLAPAGV